MVEPRRHRLVADHMDALLQEGLRHREVQVVRGDDDHRVDTVGTPRLAPGHVSVIGIAAFGVQTQFKPTGQCALRVGGQGPGDQFVAIVQAGSSTVCRGDETALATANEADTYASLHVCFHQGFTAGPKPSTWASICGSVPLAAKSSNARSATRMVWRRINSAPSRAPSSGCLRQHSHSSTAHPA